MLAHCPIDDICLPVFENIYILCIFFSYIYIFLKTTLETSVVVCALMCLYPR